jgi:hypothetical protein
MKREMSRKLIHEFYQKSKKYLVCRRYGNAAPKIRECRAEDTGMPCRRYGNAAPKIRECRAEDTGMCAEDTGMCVDDTGMCAEDTGMCAEDTGKHATFLIDKCVANFIHDLYRAFS